MNDGANIMAALAPGEGAASAEDVFVSFLGKQWCVRAYIGTPHNGGALIIGAGPKEADPEAFAREFIAAACVCMIGTAGSSAHTLDGLARMLAEKFSDVAVQMAAHRSARGKPS